MKPDRSSILLARAVFAASTLCILLPNAHAASVSFSETVNNSNWTTAADWFVANANGSPSATAAAIPAAGDTVYVGYQSNSAMTGMNYNVVTASAPLLSTFNLNASTAPVFTFTQNNVGTLLSASTENIGVAADGADYELLAGTNSAGALNVGIGVSGQGKYHVGPGTSATVNAVLILVGENTNAFLGGNQFIQDGGTVNASTGIEVADNGNGSYTLNNGIINTNRLIVGNVGVGIMSQTGGTVSSGNEQIGEFAGNGTYNQSGGTNTSAVGSFLIIGINPGDTGAYNLGPTATLIADSEHIGDSGNGTFTQTGGNHTANTTINIAFSNGSNGCYSMSGGNLTANLLVVGNGGTANFTQSAGNVTLLGSLSIAISSGGNGVYNLSGTGCLSVSGNEALGDLLGSVGAFNQSGGTHSVAGTLFVGFQAGSNGAFSLTGGKLTATNEFIGFANGPTDIATFTQSAGNNTISPTGNLTIASGFNTTGSYALSGTGNLTASNEYIGGSGVAVFNQSGGNHTIVNAGLNSLYIATSANGFATYNLSGGTLTAPFMLVDSAANATGIFNQTGGSVTISNTLYIADQGTGTYTMDNSVSPSTLAIANSLFVGYHGGNATFNQNAGTISGSSLFIQVGDFGNSTYNLNSGNISASGMAIANAGTGAFIQNAGNVTLSSYLIVGSSANADAPSEAGHGSYRMFSGSSLIAASEIIGFTNGVGTFTQFGGTNSLASTFDTFTINNLSSYTLQGGFLFISPFLGQSVNNGNFLLSGGTLNGTLSNVGNFSFLQGTFNGNLENEISGNITLISDPIIPGTGNFIINGELLNLGAFNIPLNTSLGATTPGTIDNENTLTFSGGSLSGSGLILNNGSLSGFGTISGSGGFTNNNLFTQGAGNIILTNTGANTNFGSFILAPGRQLEIFSTISFNNSGALSLNGALVSGSGTLNNASGGTLLGPGTISSLFTNSGTILPGAGTLNILTPWTNSGIIQLAGITSNIGGSTITNAALIQGIGTVSAPVINTGTISPTAGNLNFTGTFSNPASGLISVTVGGSINLLLGLPTNAGLISLAGGIFDTNNHPLNNTGQITGYGTLRSGLITNNNILTFTGSNGATTTINADILNNPAKTLNIKFNPAIFTGNVTNNGIIKTTSTTATFAATFTNNGAFLSDPSTNIFQSTTTNAGSMSGSSGDAFYFFSGSFANSGSFTNGGILSSADNITNTGTFSQSGPQTWSNNTTFTNNAGAASFATDTGTPTSFPLSFLINSGVVTFTANQHLQSLKITDATAPRLNLTNTKIIVEDTAASRLSDIQALRNQAVTNNLGIYSSTAQAANTLAGKTIFAVAVVNNAVRIATFPSGSTNFGATNNVDSNSILLTATYKGDANLDGVVDIQDLTDVANHWQQSVTDWSQGDFDNSNFVDIQDLTSIANNWQAGVGSGSGQSFSDALASLRPSTTPTPEPASLALLSAGGLLFARRPRRAGFSHPQK